MRAFALLLPALFLLLACKQDAGDTGGSSGSTGCSDDNIGDADPNYPPCSCDLKCEDGAECRFSAMSSICQPECTNGPTCKDAVDPCKDSDCPTLAGITATCGAGHCMFYCNDKTPCPSGYVCGDNLTCQAER